VPSHLAHAEGKRGPGQTASGLVQKATLVRIEFSDQIERISRSELRPAVLNDKVYKPVSPEDPAVIALARDIGEKGQVLEALIVTLDNVILSGHRRHCAAGLAQVEVVPVRRMRIHSTDPKFAEYLVACNRQRVKSIAEQIREEVIRTSPEDAHNALLAHRKAESAKVFRRIESTGLRVLEASEAAYRSEISDVKRPMLEAAIGIFERYRDYWPLTLRQVHYRMLNLRVLRNSKRANSFYINDDASYKDLSDLLTRARLTGEVQWAAMHDPTRSRVSWRQYDSVGQYMREQLNSFLTSYKRNLLQSQPCYVELVVEKITVQEIAERAAGMYHVPVGVGRGYSSVTSLDQTAERFFDSGKEKFVLLIAGDLDPEGENIAEVWDRCLRDEHDVHEITTIKVGVNPDQVRRYSLAPMPVKATSSRAKKFGLFAFFSGWFLP
jgi:hypothetical protein